MTLPPIVLINEDADDRELVSLVLRGAFGEHDLRQPLTQVVRYLGQLERLRSMGCLHGQGYWFAQPLDVPSAEELIASNAVW